MSRSDHPAQRAADARALAAQVDAVTTTCAICHSVVVEALPQACTTCSIRMLYSASHYASMLTQLLSQLDTGRMSDAARAGIERRVPRIQIGLYEAARTIAPTVDVPVPEAWGHADLDALHYVAAISGALVESDALFAATRDQVADAAAIIHRISLDEVRG